MMIVNRFLAVADRFEDRPVELSAVLGDARAGEEESVIEALYVIADRRAHQGNPVVLEEIADAIPQMLSDHSVLDAAVEISIDGLVASGCSRDEACSMLADMAGTRISEAELASVTDVSVAMSRSIQHARAARYRLPSRFGNPGHDGEPRYELRRLLGSGNQGTVYEAVDHVFRDDNAPAFVALKILHETAKGEPDLREGRHARRIRNKHVATVTDQGQTAEGELYVAYELIDGKPLDDWIRAEGKTADPRAKCAIALRIARGVQAAHAAGVVHRDLKPSNILMTREGEPVISDFGIAADCVDDPRLCAHYGTRGSLAFMAPEQYAGAGESVAPSVDIYAVGGILYWMLVSRFPNGDRVADAIEWLEEHDGGGPGRAKPVGVGSRLEQILFRALDVDPAQRYQSAAELATDLESFLNHKPVDWLDRSPGVRALLFVRRNPAISSLYLAVLGLIAGLVGFGVHYQNQIEFERQAATHQARVQELDHRVQLEHARTEEIKKRVEITRVMIQSWAKAIGSETDKDHAMSDLLFLYMVSTQEMLKEDPDFAQEVLHRRASVAEEYLEQLDPTSSSPLHRAMWHEIVADWATHNDEISREHHLDEASRLVREFAPGDRNWIELLERSRNRDSL